MDIYNFLPVYTKCVKNSLGKINITVCKIYFNVVLLGFCLKVLQFITVLALSVNYY